MNGNIKILLLIILIGILVSILSFYIYLWYGINRKPSNYCGSWSPFGGVEGNPPTCKCDGTIVRKGGPTRPADDSGGHYECIGTIISDSK